MNYFRIKETISIHQPLFIPWIPYMARLSVSDTFVVLDDVQYRKDYYQNRTIIKERKSERREWLTISVKHRLEDTIKSVEIEKNNILKKVKNKIYHNYHDKKYFSIYWEPIESLLINSKSVKLIDLNISFIELFFDVLNINKPSIFFSSVICENRDRTEKIINICQFTQKKIFLNGWGRSLEIHNQERLREEIIFVRLDKEKVMREVYNEFLEQGLGFLDIIFNYSPKIILNNIEIIRQIYLEEVTECLNER